MGVKQRAWLATIVFVLSPFVLLLRGGLPPDNPWRLVVWLVLGGTALHAIWRSRTWLLLLSLPLVLVTLVVAMNGYYPCWRSSNAAWCGHFCDDDPCACPGRTGYGAGTGCESER